MKYSERFKLILIFLLLSLTLSFVFFKLINYRFTSFDGFQYLAMAKSFWSFKFDYKLLYRSPLVAALFIPNVLLARIEEMVLYIANSYLFYLFVRKKLKIKEALTALLLYAFCWWNIVFILNTESEYFALFFLLLSFLVSNAFLRGFLAGISFLIRPDGLVFLLPYFLFLEEKRQKYAVGFFVSSIVLEAFLNFVVYRRIGLSYIDFFIVNFVEKLPWQLEAHGIYWSSFAFTLAPYLALLPGLVKLKNLGRKKRNFLLSSFLLVGLMGFLPATNDRIFFAKILLLTSIFGACFLEKNKTSIFLIAVFLTYNFAFIFKLNYSSWSESLNCEGIKGDVCSNFPSLVYLQCSIIARYSKTPSCETPVFFSLPK